MTIQFESPLFIAGELLFGFSLTVVVGLLIATIGDRSRPPRS
jgi:hypothetical protein